MSQPLRWSTRIRLAVSRFVFRRENRWYHYAFAPLLLIASLLYGLIVALRRRRATRGATVDATVVSLGNLTVGGSGKTPVTIWLATILANKQAAVAVLCGGYGGSWRQKNRVLSDGTKLFGGYAEVGDEALMLAQNLLSLKIPVIVGRHRAKSAAIAVNQFAAKILLVDDGYQHVTLNKDIEILVVNRQNPYGNGQLVPWGALREPLSAARRADVIWLTHSADSSMPEKLEPWVELTPVIYGRYQIVGVKSADSQHVHSISTIEKSPILAFSGIAHPQSFRATLHDAGFQIANVIGYPDHHCFSDNELIELKRVASSAGQLLVTTEKDFARLNAAQRSGVHAVTIKLTAHGATERLMELLAHA